jgi:hypothetical protein
MVLYLNVYIKIVTFYFILFYNVYMFGYNNKILLLLLNSGAILHTICITHNDARATIKELLF